MNGLTTFAFGNVFGKSVNLTANNINDFHNGNVRMFFKNNENVFTEIDSKYYVNSNFDCWV